jgi:hypothetical protein
LYDVGDRDELKCGEIYDNGGNDQDDHEILFSFVLLIEKQLKIVLILLTCMKMALISSGGAVFY